MSHTIHGYWKSILEYEKIDVRGYKRCTLLKAAQGMKIAQDQWLDTESFRFLVEFNKRDYFYLAIFRYFIWQSTLCYHTTLLNHSMSPSSTGIISNSL